MKKLLIFGLIMTISLFSINCNNGDEDEDTPTPTPADGTISANIDGVAWSTTEGSGTYSSEQDLTIIGTHEDGSNLGFAIFETQTGTHNLTMSNQGTVGTAFYNTDNSGSSTTYTISTEDCSGELNFTEINFDDSTATGTFHFKLFRHSDSTYVDITNGVFTNITFTGESPVISGNSMSCKVDGTTYTPPTISGLDNGTMLVLNGTNGTQTVGLCLPPGIAAGTYSLSYAGDYSGSYSLGSTIIYKSITGTLTITNHNTSTKRIEGTFSFEANDFMQTGTPVNITSGTFGITYSTM